MKDEDEPASPEGFADRLKARTWTLHREAERSGVLQDILRGRAATRPYALLLRSLLPVYEAIEKGLDAHAASPWIAPLAQPAVYRAAALRADLHAIAGPAWAETLPLLPSAERYALRVARCAASDGAGLVAHAYVRFLGDLNGGQILMRLLGRHLGLGPSALNLYAFSDPDLAQRYRAAVDRAGLAVRAAEPVLDEGEAAFRLSIALSDDVLAATRAELTATTG